MLKQFLRPLQELLVAQFPISSSIIHHFSSKTALDSRGSSPHLTLVHSVLDDGKGPGGGRTPLIILHALFGQRSNWRSIASFLQQRLRNPVILVDLRNHGDSPWSDEMTYTAMAGDVRHLVARDLGFDKVHILGHSMGGKVGARLAMDHPELLEKLVLVDVVPRPYHDADTMRNFYTYIDAMSKMRFQSSSEKVCNRSTLRKHAEEQLKNVICSPAIRQFLLLNLTFNHEGVPSWKLNLESIRENMGNLRDFPGPFGQFPGKTLLVSGTSSTYVTSEDVTNLRKRTFPMLKHAVLKGGHWLNADNANGLVDVIKQFIDS